VEIKLQKGEFEEIGGRGRVKDVGKFDRG